MTSILTEKQSVVSSVANLVSEDIQDHVYEEMGTHSQMKE